MSRRSAMTRWTASRAAVGEAPAARVGGALGGARGVEARRASAGGVRRSGASRRRRALGAGSRVHRPSAWRCEEPGGSPGRSRHCDRCRVRPGSQELAPPRDPSERDARSRGGQMRHAGSGGPPEDEAAAARAPRATAATRAARLPASTSRSTTRGRAAAARARRPLCRAAARRCRSPALRCRETAARRGARRRAATPALAECDFGRWAGRTLAEVDAADPTAARAWMTDPDAAPARRREPARRSPARVGGLARRAGATATATPSRSPTAASSRRAVVHALGAPLAGVLAHRRRAAGGDRAARARRALDGRAREPCRRPA